MSSPGAGGQYRINLVWTSHGGQVLATMGQIQSGMRQVGGTSLREGRNLGYFNRQMQAIGTTMRYFFAGGAIFGTMSAFQQFAEFESKLGNLAALAPEIRANLSEFGQGFLKTSTAIATPVGEIEDSARNILSTLQLSSDQMEKFLPRFTTLFSQGAKIAETDAYNFGNAVLGMNNAFDRSMNDMENTAGQFFTVIQRSAGMTGDEWAKFSGRVVAGAGQAGASLEEMNALMVLMTRQGATAATNARHMAQFLMQLRNPTEEAKPFWRDIGLSPDELRTMPFENILDTLVREVRKRGGLKRGRKMSDDAIMALEEAGALDTLPGMEGGGAGLLTDLFGRMESRRAAGVVISEILAGGRPGRPSYDALLTEMKDVEEQNKKIQTGFEAWLDRNKIQQAGQAIRNMITESLLPAEKQIMRIAEKITELADPRLVQGAAAAALGYGALKGFRGAGRFIRGAGTVGIALNQGGAPPTGSFANPFWVIIHPLSNVPGLGGVGGGGKGGAGGGAAGGPGKAGRGGRILGRLGGIAKGVPKAGIVGGAGALIWPDELGAAIQPTDSTVINKMLADRIKKEKLPPAFMDFARESTLRSNPTYNEQQVQAAIKRNFWILTEGFKQFRIIPSAEQLAAAQSTALRMSGVSRVEESRLGIFVDASDEAKRLLNLQIGATAGARVHIPPGHSAWSGGPTPQYRGRH